MDSATRKTIAETGTAGEAGVASSAVELEALQRANAYVVETLQQLQRERAGDALESVLAEIDRAIDSTLSFVDALRLSRNQLVRGVKTVADRLAEIERHGIAGAALTDARLESPSEPEPSTPPVEAAQGLLASRRNASINALAEPRGEVVGEADAAEPPVRGDASVRADRAGAPSGDPVLSYAAPSQGTGGVERARGVSAFRRGRRGSPAARFRDPAPKGVEVLRSSLVVLLGGVERMVDRLVKPRAPGFATLTAPARPPTPAVAEPAKPISDAARAAATGGPHDLGDGSRPAQPEKPGPSGSSAAGALAAAPVAGVPQTEVTDPLTAALRPSPADPAEPAEASAGPAMEEPAGAPADEGEARAEASASKLDVAADGVEAAPSDEPIAIPFSDASASAIGGQIDVVVHGCTSFNLVGRLQDALRTLPMLEGLRVRRFHRGSLFLTISYVGGALDDEIGKIDVGGRRLRILKSTPDRIEATFPQNDGA